MTTALPLPAPAPDATAAAPDLVVEAHAARRARHVQRVLIALATLLIGGVVASVAVGAVSIPPGALAASLGARVGLEMPWEATAQQDAVLWAIRLPRVVLGVVVGAGLAVSGALMQGLFRNPLADPGLVGVSAGAALGAAVAIVLASPILRLGASVSAPVATAILGPALVAFAAFIGGLTTTMLVYRLATRGGRTSVTTMLLAGIAVNALCGAAVGALVLFADDGQLRDLTFWTLGSLGGATWGALAVVVPLVAGVALWVPRLAAALNALLLGESEARHLGVRVERVKRTVVTLAAVAVGAATAVAGLVGFVGLVAPHVVRLLLGPDHRALLPASALAGAALVVAADLAARVVLAPAEVPIGIVTALAGAPVFLWLLLRQRPA